MYSKLNPIWGRRSESEATSRIVVHTRPETEGSIHGQGESALNGVRRPAPSSVTKLLDELWIGVKC